MPVRTIEAIVKVEEDRKLVLQLPPDIPVGTHHVVAVLDETAEATVAAANGPAAAWVFPVLTNAQWPADMPLTRAEMYDDDGR